MTTVIHLVSDATGETAARVLRACMVQFKVESLDEYDWPFIRSIPQVEEILHTLEVRPGLVVSTLVQEEVKQALADGCARLGIPHVSLLDPLMTSLSDYLGTARDKRPGIQYKTDEAYYRRINAIEFAVAHDDGASPDSLHKAEVVILGVSRMSKTPCSMYLAYRGVLAGNIPLIMEQGLPPRVEELLKQEQQPLIIGLTQEVSSLVAVRQNRLAHLTGGASLSYTDRDAVRREVLWSQQLFNNHGIPIINVTNRSIEETAALIMQRLHKGQPHHELV
jgi:[pyruvate, water dikinase]-phosphate phosphotransferase / [pyruvate, water dikinase] kinase